MPIHFEITRRLTLRGWRYRYSIIAANGRDLSPNQPYNSKQSAQEVIELIKSLGPHTPVIDNTK